MKINLESIPASNMAEIGKVIKRLNKKGFPANLDIIKVYDKEVTVYNDSYHMYKVGKAVVQVVDFTISIENANLGEWELLGTKERFGNDVMYFGNVPNEYQNDNFSCEHCNTNHYRKVVCVIRNMETKEIKQVGKSCLKDFCGTCTSAFKSLLDSITCIYRDYNNYVGECEHYDHVYVDVNLALNIAYNIIVKYGYKKNGTYSNVPTTRDRVSDTYFRDEAADEADFLGVADKALCESIKEAYLEYLEKDHDSMDETFYKNMKVILSKEYVPSKYFNYLYFVPLTYIHNKNIKTNTSYKKPAVNNEYVGEIGERIKVSVTITKSYAFDSDYGTSHLLIMKDTSNHVLTWFTTVEFDDGFFEGDKTLTIKGTIKEHKEYRGTKQTVLTRCKVTSCTVIE